MCWNQFGYVSICGYLRVYAYMSVVSVYACVCVHGVYSLWWCCQPPVAFSELLSGNSNVHLLKCFWRVSLDDTQFSVCIYANDLCMILHFLPFNVIFNSVPFYRLLYMNFDVLYTPQASCHSFPPFVPFREIYIRNSTGVSFLLWHLSISNKCWFYMAGSSSYEPKWTEKKNEVLSDCAD